MPSRCWPRLNGPVAPAAWRGSLPMTYHVGPGPAKVHLKAQFNWDTKPIYDVVARIPGATYPDEWIIRGNHHDAWVNGAEDPVSGAVALMEEARALGTLLKQGWKPKRTIILCLWDGEEEGLLGSTEWAEAHAGRTAQKRRGRTSIPTATGAAICRWKGRTRWRNSSTAWLAISTIPKPSSPCGSGCRCARLPTPGRGRRATAPDLRIGALGSGSDYTAFLDYLGVASVNMGFGGEDQGGIYHSVYDDFYWYTHFADTNFVYGRALAQTAGTAVMRLADAELLPYDFDNFTDTIRRYIDEVQKLAKDKRDQIVERNKRIDEGMFAATMDPRVPMSAPAKESSPAIPEFRSARQRAGGAPADGGSLR